MINQQLPYVAIGDFFGCDHTSIIYHARKLGMIAGDRKVIRLNKVKLNLTQRSELPKIEPVDNQHYILKTERINLGKADYAAYLKEDRDRKVKRIIINGIVF